MKLISTLLPLSAAVSLSLAAGVASRPTSGAAGDVELPVVYDADRFVLAPVTASGDTLTFLLDTGGGTNMLYPAAVARFGLVPDTVGEGDDRAVVVAPPALAPGAALPPWPPGPRASAPFMVIAPPPGFGEGRSGFLGRTWFADRTWTLDYPGHRLVWHPEGPPALQGAGQTSLGFQADASGRRTMHFPRMQAVIDGDTLDLLFDTGATTFLGDSALRVLNDGRPAVRGASFITTSVINRWLGRHPDWRVIPNAERTMRLVEVPEIRIGGVVTGPVWFTERADRNFTEYMSQWMDQPIVGALGGSAFRNLVLTIDYPSATLWVRRP